MLFITLWVHQLNNNTGLIHRWIFKSIFDVLVVYLYF